jgi:hypothetical protein
MVTLQEVAARREEELTNELQQARIRIVELESIKRTPSPSNAQGAAGVTFTQQEGAVEFSI